MRWLPRLLFLITVLLSLGLAAAVFISPLLGADERAGLWSDMRSMFAGDMTVRRTAVASAIGLMVTAWIFFRTRATSDAGHKSAKKAHRPPPGNVAGA